MTDPRLTDDRVKAARKPKWDQHPAEWDVSSLDRMDGVGVDDSLNPPARPVRAVPVPIAGRVIEDDPHGYRSIFRNAVVLGSSTVIVLACVAFGYFIRAVTS